MPLGDARINTPRYAELQTSRGGVSCAAGRGKNFRFYRDQHSGRGHSRQIRKIALIRISEVGVASFRILQILDHRTSHPELDPGFEVIDNSSDERPDWREYWPIRKFLLAEALDEDTFYGFLSPQFATETHLTAVQVFELVRHCDSRAEVMLFAPGSLTEAQYLNVFEQGDAEHPGLMATSKRLLARINRHADLDELVTDSTNTVPTNYLVAKPRFWRQWLAINEAMFTIAEARGDELGRALTSCSSSRGRTDVQMKVLIMERIATLILVSDPSFVGRVCAAFPDHKICRVPLAIVCDALKIAYRVQGFGQYKDVFRFVRAQRRFWNFEISLGRGSRLRACVAI